MKIRAHRLRRLQAVFALVLGCLLVSSASAETYRILERMPSGNVVSRAAEVQEPRDGLDPVTYHETFSAPTDSRHAQILWVSSGNAIVIDRESTTEAGGYPMVVSASIPTGGDLLYQVSSAKEGGVVSSFTHTTSGPDWSVDQEKLAALEEGEYTLHVTIRAPGADQTRATQRIDIRGARKDGGRVPVVVLPPVVEPPNPIDPVELTPLMEWELPADGRIIYVSSSTGNDSNNGRSPQTAVRTLDRGYALVRDTRPDWLLLKRGDVWEMPVDETGDFRAWHKSGRSALEPMIIGAYGDADDPRPRIDSNGGSAMKYLYVDNLVIRDLHFYANQRDPESPDFDGGGSYREFGLHMARAENVVIQGCLIEYFHTNVMIRTDDDPEDTRLTNIRFNRCIIRNAYRLDGDDAHGMYIKHAAGIALTECVFDHNGWIDDVDDAYRTGRSHNVYFSDSTQMTIEGCVFSRESYLSLKIRCEIEDWCRDVSIRDNLFLGCPYPVELGDNGPEDVINYVDVTMQDNVFARTIGWPIDAPRNLAVKITRARNVLVDRNLFVDNGVHGSDRNEAVRASASHALENITISNNDAFLPTPSGDDMFSTHYRDQRIVAGVRFINNRQNIAHGLYADASVSVENYMRRIGRFNARNDPVDDLMILLADELTESDPATTIADVVQYYQDGFTLVQGN
ncbi:right-handed parallel beta-helix repeat-containing protein [Phycisphaeraceae bacterium D3-23]